MSYMLDVIKLEMELATDVWADVSADVIPPITGYQGIQGNGPLDRVASAGRMTFFMDNGETNSAGQSRYYTPGSTDARSGFEVGTNVRLHVEKEGMTRYRFQGRIEKILPYPDPWGPRITKVIAGDWISMCEDHRMTLPSFAQDKRADEIIPLIVANMPIAPEETEYNQGISTFPFVFDTVRDNTSAYREIQKVIMSEFGHCYLKSSNTSGEVLVVEGREHRSAERIDTKQVPSNPGLLLADGGGYLKISANGFMKIAGTTSISFDNTMVAMQPKQSGNHMANRVTAITYPREVDAVANTKLFELQNSIQLDDSETKTGYRVTYRDPDGAATRVTGRDMATPTSDYYAANTESDGGGSDVTSDLVVTATYGTEGAEYTLQNTSTDTIYVTQLDAVGRGVYLYDPVQYVTEDTDLQDTHGVKHLKISMPYQSDPTVGEDYSNKFLTVYKNPRNDPEPFTVSAHSNLNQCLFFVIGNVGDKVILAEEQTGTTSDFYYVQGMRWRIDEGDIVHYSITTMHDDIYDSF